VLDTASRSGVSLNVVMAELGALTTTVGTRGMDELQYRSVEIMDTLGWIVMAVLLSMDASRDDDAAAAEVLRRWLAKKDEKAAAAANERPWQEIARADTAIAFGANDSTEVKARL